MSEAGKWYPDYASMDKGAIADLCRRADDPNTVDPAACLDISYLHFGCFNRVRFDFPLAIQYAKKGMEADDVLCAAQYAHLRHSERGESRRIARELFEQIRDILFPLANKDNPYAQFFRGFYEQNFIGNEAVAKDWFKRAALNWHAEAVLAFAKLSNDPREHSLKQAFIAAAKFAARSGLVQAEFEAGKCHLSLIDIEGGMQESFRWIYKAATQGLPDAIKCLFNVGIDIPRSDRGSVEDRMALSLQWLSAAKECGSPEAERLFKKAAIRPNLSTPFPY